MRHAHSVLLATVVVATVGSCAPAVRSERDESIPVPQGATWTWSPADTSTRADRATSPVSEIVQQRFRRAMEAAMAAKGYRLAADAAQADFVLAASFEALEDGVPVRRNTAVMVGFSTGWGYRPWGFGRFGYFGPWGPWGLYQPWGFYAPMWGGYAAPAYVGGRRTWSDRALMVVLRDRPSGQVAWSARLGSDALSSHRLTQDRVQDLVNRLFKDLH